MVSGIDSLLCKYPCPPPANQTDDALVQGGSLAGEGEIYFSLRLPTEKSK